MHSSQKSRRPLYYSAILIISAIITIMMIGNSTHPLKTTPLNSPEIQAIIDSAIEQTHITTSYDPAYVIIPYPDGDVPSNTGVCSDVVIRAFRKAGVDLQAKVHEDMHANFAAYPLQWGLTRPDSSIDHRRVPNLMTYFKRQGKSFQITLNAADYHPGDVVAWDFGAGKTHIGLVCNKRNLKTGRFLIVHNAGMGTRLEDRLFDWPIIGHYRYF
ncbi:MAG: DUF1287 domain-containing protein [Armatimonadota bacterium]